MLCPQVLALPAAGTKPGIGLAPDVGGRLGLRPGQKLSVAFGLRTVLLPLTIVRDLPVGTISLTSPAADALSVPLPLSVGLFPETRPERWAGLLNKARATLRLGPIVVIMTSRQKLESVLNGHEDTVYLRYDRYAKEIGAILYFFSTAGIDLRTEQIRAFSLQGHQWEEKVIPLPRVVYDRCFGEVGRTESRFLRQLAAQKGITIVNQPLKITKLESFAALEQHPGVRPLLPPTEPLTRKSLESFTLSYPSVYLKPTGRSKGYGVFRMTCQEGQWIAKVRESSGDRTWNLKNPAKVLGYLPEEEPYLVQQGLPLATYLGNAYDFRVLVQKDGQGHWQVTGAVARVMPEDGVISSPRSGGLVTPALRALSHSFGGDRAARLLTEMEKASELIALCTEVSFGRCAELGLDIGVTREGEIRLIEVNGKPLKVSLTRLGDPAVTGRINRFPVYYAAHLDLVG